MTSPDPTGASAPDADAPEAWLERGFDRLRAVRPVEALDCFDEALARRPGLGAAEGPRFEAAWKALYAAVNACDWRRYDDVQRIVAAQIRCGKAFVGETALAAPAVDAAAELAGARAHSRALADAEKPFVPRPPEGKIRLGFLGADFHQQATAYLLTGVIERFDRERFDVIAYDFGPDTDSAMRRRCLCAYDAVVPVHALSDREAAARIHADGIDVLLHLRGPVNGRLGVLAHRPCSVQIQYLYFPGTSARIV